MPSQMMSELVNISKDALDSTVAVALVRLGLSSQNMRSLISLFKKVPNIRWSHLFEESSSFVFKFFFFFLFLALASLELALHEILINDRFDLVNGFSRKNLQHDEVFDVLNNMAVNMS